MGLLSDALRHLLATDAAERRAGLAGLVGRMFGTDPIVVRHPSIPADLPFDLVHYPKSGGGLAPRGFAITLTIGLAEAQGREIVAVTLADVREPAADRIAWMLASARDVQPGAVAPLPPGCLGRSSHACVLVTEPWIFPARDRPDYERIVGGRLDLAVPITAREADFVDARGSGPFLDAMREQAQMPYADRPAGETRLPG